MTIQGLLDRGNSILKEKKIDSSKSKAKILLMFVLEKEREYLVINHDKQVEKELEEKYLEYIDEVCKGTPIQHITHKQEFYKLNFYVDENVLIPRPDTEILVEEVIRICNQKFKEKEIIKILDLCTGSGAIAVAVAKNVSNVRVVGTDISNKALEIAKKNAKNNQVDSHGEYIKSDLFSNIKDTDFDIIVSNPPYIETEVINTLGNEVKKEPKIALDGGINGLDFYTQITKEAPDYLKDNGFLCFEIGYNQKLKVMEMFVQDDNYMGAFCKKDLTGQDRIVVGRIKER